MKKILLLVAVFTALSISASFAAYLSEYPNSADDETSPYPETYTAPKYPLTSSGAESSTLPQDGSMILQQQMPQGQYSPMLQRQPGSADTRQRSQEQYDGERYGAEQYEQYDGERYGAELYDAEQYEQYDGEQNDEVDNHSRDTAFESPAGKGIRDGRATRDGKGIGEGKERGEIGDARGAKDGKKVGKKDSPQKLIKRSRTRDVEVTVPSALERAMSQNPIPAEKVRSQPSRMEQLTQFGYSFFKPESARFASQTDVPVGPDYLVGVGDRLVVTVWGSLNGTFTLEVSRSGEIVLPKVGTVKVAGQSFGELPALLKASIGRIYKDFQLNVSMGKLRLIKVYLVGEVKAPGDYNVSSLSTLLSALATAGGPTKNGSLRNIKINRNGKLIETVDLYDFFLKGDKGKDIRLQPGDTILVPVIGPVAGLAGNVRRPAIYELKDERTLKELLALGNGINPSGYLQRVQLYRVEAHDKKVVTDFNLDTRGQSLDEASSAIAIQDRDFVKVLSIDNVLRGYVRLNGHVLRPGDFALKPGMKVSALLGSDNLLPEYYGEAGQIIRLIPPDLRPEVLFFDVSGALKGEPGDDLELQEFDRVKIFARSDMEEIPVVRVSGEVQKAGQFRFFQNMTIRDLVMNAGNVKQTAYLKNAEITRLRREGDAVSSYSITVDLGKALQGGADNIKLEPFDELTVRRIPNWAEATERYVTLRGEFVFPGTYPIFKGERLSSVLARAGGFTDHAYVRGAKFTRELARQLQQQRMTESLDKAQEDIIKLQTAMAQTASSAEEVAASKVALEGLMRSVEVLRTKKAEGRMLVEIASLQSLKGSIYDLELQGGDEFSIPSDPGGVNVIGDVYNQNTIVTQRGKSVEWYMDQVGGATKDAARDEIYVVKVDGSVISQANSNSFLFYNAFWGKQLDSGDTVIVPRQYEKTAWLRNIKDIAQILGNIAVTAGVLVAAGLF